MTKTNPLCRHVTAYQVDRASITEAIDTGLIPSRPNFQPNHLKLKICSLHNGHPAMIIALLTIKDQYSKQKLCKSIRKLSTLEKILMRQP